MLWEPTDSWLVLKVETPALEIASVARMVLPSLNCTSPVGTPLADESCAVKVTVWPKVDGFGELVRVSVVEQMLWVPGDSYAPMSMMQPLPVAFCTRGLPSKSVEMVLAVIARMVCRTLFWPTSIAGDVLFR